MEATTCRLASKRHGGPIEPAERAMHALAPPAPARGLEEYRGLPFAIVTARFELLEEVAVVGNRQLVHLANHRPVVEPAGRKLFVDSLPHSNARQIRQRLRTEHAPGELREHEIGLTRHRGIDE